MSYPDIPIGDEISKFKEDSYFISRSIENKSLAKDSISNRPPLDQNKFSKRRCISTKPPSFKKNASFSDRLKEGWTKEQLMKHYSVSEEEYEKLIVCIKNIHK